MPCYKLDLRFNRADMVKRFVMSGRSGFYFSVIETGEVHAGSDIQILRRDHNRVTVAELNGLFLGQIHDRELLQRAIKVDVLPDYWRANLSRMANEMPRA
jgi:MOSC domain-containing protein YiiM